MHALQALPARHEPTVPHEAISHRTLPIELRDSLRRALNATFGDIDPAVDVDTVAFDLLEGVGFLVSRRVQDIHRSRPGTDLTTSPDDGTN
jgi:hypothetical protein